jgi:hypothetical protein
VALRLLDGDERIVEAVRRGELSDLVPGAGQEPATQPLTPSMEVA